MGIVRVLSRSSQRFKDRTEAGELLSSELAGLRGQKAVALGVPRGGIVIARELARQLDADLDIVISRKLRTPGSPELAMGSVSENGDVFLNENVVQELGISKEEIEREKTYQLAEIARRASLIRRVWPKVPIEGRIAIVTDDGVATGATMQAALWSIRHEEPSRIIAALPVATDEAVSRLSLDADELVCLRMPPFFGAVGQFYVHFEPVEDEDVLEILRQEQRRKDEEKARRR